MVNSKCINRPWKSCRVWKSQTSDTIHLPHQRHPKVDSESEEVELNWTIPSWSANIDCDHEPNSHVSLTFSTDGGMKLSFNLLNQVRRELHKTRQKQQNTPKIRDNGWCIGVLFNNFSLRMDNEVSIARCNHLANQEKLRMSLHRDWDSRWKASHRHVGFPPGHADVWDLKVST